MSDVTHAYRLTLVPHAARLEGELLLPAGAHLLETVSWVPGAYAFMRYGRDLVDVRAEDAETGTPLAVVREGWTGYRVATAERAVRVRFRVAMADVAWGELAGYVSLEHAVVHATRVPHVRALGGAVRVEWIVPADWAMHHPAGAAAEGSHTFVYPSFAAWLDLPVVAGAFTERTRKEGSTTFHHVFLERAVGMDTELDAFVDDVQKLARVTGEVFGSFPFAEYTFVWSFDSRMHWGLEHANSTLVGVGPLCLVDPEARFSALRVAAHELVHAWNVCRLKPAALVNVDLVAGGFPGELWVAEGFTRYYEFLLTARAGFCSAERFFANVVNYHRGTTTRPGYERTTPLDSSQATFLNHHRYPNAANTMIDYYDAGMLVAFDVDAYLRCRQGTLDTGFRALYTQFGTSASGYTHDDVCSVFAELGAEALIRTEVETAGALSTVERLRELGFTCDVTAVPTLGVVLDGERIVHVLEGSGAEAAGLHCDDRIVAHDGLAFSATGLAWLIAHRTSLELTVRRGDRQHVRIATLGTRREITRLVFEGGTEHEARLTAWLGSCPAVGTEISLRPYDNFHGTERAV